MSSNGILRTYLLDNYFVSATAERTKNKMLSSRNNFVFQNNVKDKKNISSPKYEFISHQTQFFFSKLLCLICQARN